MGIPLKPIDVKQPTSMPTPNLYHVEGKNETLESISKATGFPLADIQDRNKHIKNPKQILTAGQDIELPDKKVESATKPNLVIQIGKAKVGGPLKSGMDSSATVSDYAAMGSQIASPKITERLEKLNTKVGDLQQYSKELQAAGTAEIRKLSELQTAGKITQKEFMDQVRAQSAAVLKVKHEIDGVEKEIQSLSHLDKGAGALKGLGETMKKLGDVKTTLGKFGFGLDVAANWAEYNDKDPSNITYNLTKAIGASSASFAANLKIPKAGAAAAGGALVKFGLECMGMKDSNLYDSVDAATQCIPTDVFAKSVAQTFDVAKSAQEILTSGGKDWTRLNKLNDANLKGDNGLVMQGASIVGDVIANGGRNIPTDGTGARMAERMGFYGHTDILTRDIGHNAEQKIGLVNTLMKNGTSNDDKIKILNLLNQSDPHTLLDTLKGLDRGSVIGHLNYPDRAIDPAATLVIDTYLKSNQASGQTQDQLRVMARDLVFKCQDFGRTEALEQLRQRGILDKLGLH